MTPDKAKCFGDVTEVEKILAAHVGEGDVPPKAQDVEEGERLESELEKLYQAAKDSASGKLPELDGSHRVTLSASRQCN